jgi:outer membrane protein assembly factor BamD (BamD/ComL family)
MAKTAAKVIANCVNGLAMKKIMIEKFWSKQDATYAVADFLTCGQKISLAEFMANYSPKSVTIQ